MLFDDELLNRDPRNGIVGIDFKAVPRLKAGRARWKDGAKVREVALVSV